MRYVTLPFLITILLLTAACRSDFDTVASDGKLAFSRDIIYLDTVFSNIGSSTYRLKVYNRSKKDITIPSIKLERGLLSKYRMTVDGRQDNQGKLFTNVTLLAKDSLYIFIETTASSTDANASDYLYTDKIEFDSGQNLQTIPLVTLVKDAFFLYPQRFADGTTETLPLIDGQKLNGFYLDPKDPINGNELHFTNQKAYVIYGYAAVPKGKTVLFDAGSRVYFHNNSGLVVTENATLQINGTPSTTNALENQVIFEADRLEPEYANLPGQWGTIWLTKGSTNHSITHLTIKNATIGLRIQDNDGTTVSIKNSQIYNCANYGILAQTARIEAQNLAINGAGIAALSCYYGGDYQFTHATFNNNWNNNSHLAVAISNHQDSPATDTKDLTKATFNNCIIYGNNTNELQLSSKPTAAFNYQFNHCLLKFNPKSTQAQYQFQTDPSHYTGIILNQNPNFLNTTKNKLHIDATSGAYAKGNPAYLIPLDILGSSRTLPPDLGAYQSNEFKK
ncbi:hypothetical protein [Flavobacterium crassostreae]|uniref:Right handed beta helix domain-containing protein n=1 Tax=Flavobacterium crassostreae TaxID=1763534 RepID=A0A1B9E0P6_9FLAO|nr:hypothetical protein [Flavobacterium crassostreae]OCB75519.1 hypothetical protein LPBF_07915 [Flavobacterium crassostreae]